MSFGAIAADYDRLRPSPAPEAVDWLLPARRDVVVDLGAGTGLLTRAVAAAAAGHVIAVEPDDRMRAVLASRSPGVKVLAGRGEAIPLPEASADAVLVSSAWHWMDTELAAPEIARVLRDGGRFGVIWTGRERTPWLRTAEWFGTDHRVQDREPTAADLATPRARQVALPDPVLFRNIETETFRFTRRMSIPDLVEWLTTYSHVITASDEVKADGRTRATAALAAEFPGAVEIEVPTRSRCWRADRAPR
jgi:ubiquinone/menaquinone biosynthesis C-methylase UbiE